MNNDVNNKRFFQFIIKNREILVVSE